MSTNFFLEGLLVGLAIAIPVGPIGVLCIQRSLQNGRLSGFFTGLGAATADGLYGAVAAFGLTWVSGFLTQYSLAIQTVGILFLVYLGITTFIQKPSEKAKTDRPGGQLFNDYFVTIGLTLTNPTTILSFMAVFAGMGIGLSQGDYVDAGIMVVGVFLGSALWWLILSHSVGLLGKRLNDGLLKGANKLSGIILLVFALVIALNLILMSPR